jgi:hypothetical protein
MNILYFIAGVFKYRVVSLLNFEGEPEKTDKYHYKKMNELVATFLIT